MISAEQIFVAIFTVWAWGLSVILAAHLHTHRQRVRDETTGEPSTGATEREAELRRRIEGARALAIDDRTEQLAYGELRRRLKCRGVDLPEANQLARAMFSFRARLRAVLSGEAEFLGESNTEPPTDAASGYGPLVPQPADDPLSGIVEELQRELDAVKTERDTLWACRAGEQGCFVCPDGNCGDNQNPKFTAGDDAARRIGELQRDLAALNVRLLAADRLAYAVADLLIAPFNGTHQTAVDELVRYVNSGIDGANGLHAWMREYKRRTKIAAADRPDCEGGR